MQSPQTSVIVVAICSVPQLTRSLDALTSQHADGGFEIIVSADPRLGSLDNLQREFPDVVFLSEEGRNTPIELTTMAIRRARGAIVVLTEDSCIAAPGWLAEMTSTSHDGRAAVGGVVEATPGISSAMWAFCYVYFFRYMRPVAEATSATLSVCNVSYTREHLDQVADLWRDGFHETEINGALQEKFGALWLRPSAEVQVRRDVTFGDAVYERYAFGRLFGATRITHATMSRRLFYIAVSPALPFLLMARMTTKARQDASLRNHFLRALPSIVTMVAAWSWGEWLGYVTGTRPRRISTAPEIVRSS